MAEKGKLFRAYEAELQHDFDTLSGRLVAAYDAVDAQAHIDGSEHSEREQLEIEQIEENLGKDEKPLLIFCQKRDFGIMKLEAYDTQGTPETYYSCNYLQEIPRDEAGKHKSTEGLPVLPDSQPATSSLSQTEEMVVMITRLEEIHRDIMTQRARIVRYE